MLQIRDIAEETRVPEVVEVAGGVIKVTQAGAESSTTGVLQILASIEGPRVWGRKLLEAPPKFGLGLSRASF